MTLTPFSILFVCTGNLCRSPMAEAVALENLGTDGSFRISSAGTNAVDGQAIPQQTTDAISRIGLPMNGQVARSTRRPLVEASDLIITMTVEQRRDVVRLAPPTTRRVFTLREFDRALRFALLPANAEKLSDALEDGDPRRRLVEFASAVRGLTASPSDADDIEDPYRKSDRAFDRAAREISPLVVDTCNAIRRYPHKDDEQRTITGDAGGPFSFS